MYPMIAIDLNFTLFSLVPTWNYTNAWMHISSLICQNLKRRSLIKCVCAR